MNLKLKPFLFSQTMRSLQNFLIRNQSSKAGLCVKEKAKRVQKTQNLQLLNCCQVMHLQVVLPAPANTYSCVHVHVHVKLQKTMHTQRYESHKCISFKSLWDPNLPKQCNDLYIHKCSALTNEVTLESSTAFNSCWSFSFLFSRFFLFFSALLLRPPVALPFQQIFNLAMKNTRTNHHQQNKQTS